MLKLGSTGKAAEERSERSDSTFTLLDIGQIAPDPDQPRKTFDDEAIAALGASIEAQGLLQPIVVRPDPDQIGHYIIIAGERRWRACRLIEKHTIEVLVREGLEAEAVRASQLIENLQRESMSPLETAAAIRDLKQHYATNRDVAAATGLNESYVSRILTLADAGPLTRRLTEVTADVNTLVSFAGLEARDEAAANEYINRVDPKAGVLNIRKEVETLAKAAKTAGKKSKKGKTQTPSFGRPLATKGVYVKEEANGKLVLYVDRGKSSMRFQLSDDAAREIVDTLEPVVKRH